MSLVLLLATYLCHKMVRAVLLSTGLHAFLGWKTVLATEQHKVHIFRHCVCVQQFIKFGGLYNDLLSCLAGFLCTVSSVRRKGRKYHPHLCVKKPAQQCIHLPHTSSSQDWNACQSDPTAYLLFSSMLLEKASLLGMCHARNLCIHVL